MMIDVVIEITVAVVGDRRMQKKTGGGGFDLKVGRLGPVNQHVYGFNTILCSIVLLTCNCLS